MGGPDYAVFNEMAGGLQALIQIHGCDQGFNGIREERLFLSSAAHFLPSSEEEINAQSEFLRDLIQPRRADQVRLELREPAFGISREPSNERFADHKTENRIAQELKLL